jgi:hypothetical protein
MFRTERKRASCCYFENSKVKRKHGVKRERDKEKKENRTYYKLQR